MQTIDIDKVALKKDLELLLDALEKAKIATYFDTPMKTFKDLKDEILTDNTSSTDI